MFQKLLTNRALWEQPIWDLWMIPHIISGILIALILRKMKFGLWTAFSINLIIAILWELFEGPTGLSGAESLSNQFADVLIAQVGFAIGIYLYNQRYRKGYTLLIYILSGVFIAVSLLGWLAYRNYISLFL